jgi:hypothetical protein
LKLTLLHTNKTGEIKMRASELAGEGEAKVIIAGTEVAVDKNASVKDTLKKILAEKGIDSFTILVDGDEINDTADLPNQFCDHNIEVERYVKPGAR